MKQLFDNVSAQCSKLTTQKYSTSFSLGIKFLDKKIHPPIYGIYGFVRFADEIVDSFHGYDKAFLLNKFRTDTVEAIENKISLNPILNSFQHAVHQYKIEWELIDTFLKSMEMDLTNKIYDKDSILTYVIGSAEVVGLMCLRVFSGGNDAAYQTLKPHAMKLGSAFQKVNFLRDLKADYFELGRSYFPEIDFEKFTLQDKEKIQQEIDTEFEDALRGIKLLPHSSRMGVYLAYVYYRKLFSKIKNASPEKIINERIRIPNIIKLVLLFQTFIRLKINRI